MKIQVKDYYTPLPPDRLKRHKELSDHWEDLWARQTIALYCIMSA